MQLRGKKDEEKNLIKNLNKKLLIIQKTKKMNLKELKSMIASEYKTYIAEQPVPAGLPGVAVSDADVDATEGGGDAESTLRDIYEMLKAHFEGGATATDTADADIPDEMDDAEVEDDDADDADEDDAEALQERFKKLANIIKG